MLNITKKTNGFSINGENYAFNQFKDNDLMISYEIVSDYQCHVGTDKGIILIDLSCTIEGKEYTDINLFIKALGIENLS